MQTRRLDIHAHLGTPHSREWVETVFAFLKGYVEEGMHYGMELLGKSDTRGYVASLLDEVRRSPNELDGGK